jgi:hypothetical protein
MHHVALTALTLNLHPVRVGDPETSVNWFIAGVLAQLGSAWATR